jgi:hypothetical protein
MMSRQKVARTWRDLVYARFNDLDPYYKKMDKNEVRQVLTSARAPIPRILRRFASAASIDLGELPDAFVLKPSSLASRRGVMVLHRQADGSGFWDALHKIHRTEADIVTEQQKWETHVKDRRLEFIAEERLIPEDGSNRIPADYKLYTFLDQVRFIIQFDRNASPTRAAFFINAFEEFDVSTRVRSRWNRIEAGVAQAPKCAGEMLELAARIGVALRTPFVSVDCYATPRGPVVGELTFTPGAPYYGRIFRFTREFSAELGAAWHEANMRLGRENPLVPKGYVVHKSRFPMKL